MSEEETMTDAPTSSGESHLLELDDLSKFYGNIIALKGVTTSVNAGEVTCVLGDNGAGEQARAMAIMTRWRMPPDSSWG